MAPNFEIITLRENTSYGSQTFIRVIKCQQAFWPEDDVNHLNHLYTISLQKRKPGLNKDLRLLTFRDFTPPIILYGEGNGNLLQYACLENPMDGGAW